MTKSDKRRGKAPASPPANKAVLDPFETKPEPPRICPHCGNKQWAAPCIACGRLTELRTWNNTRNKLHP